MFALCVVGIWFLQCLLDALRDKGGILRGFLLPFTAALPCFAIPLAWKLLLKALHRADDQFSSMGPGYFLQCWQEARTGFDRYFYDVWDRYYARLRSYPLLFGASTFKVGCLCAAAAVLLFNRSDLGHGAVAGAAHGAAGAVHDLVLAALSGRVVLCVHLRHEPL